MTIDGRTKISLFTVAGMVPVLCTVIFWLASLNLKVDYKDKIDDKQDQKIDSALIMLVDIREKIIRLEVEKDNRGTSPQRR